MKVYWEWLCSLRRESESVKIDPERVTCQCGYSWRPGTYEKIVMLVRGHYTKTCPRCQSHMKLVLIEHVVCVERNNLDKKELWKRS